MYQLNGFWDIRFIDFFPIITAVISPLIIYWIYKKLNELKEMRKIQIVFLRFKEYLKSTLPEYKDYIGYQMSFASNSFFKTQIENLIKIGISVMNTENNSNLLIILDKYLFTGMDLRYLSKNKKETIDADVNSYEKILNEILEYSKNNYKIKLNKKLAKLK